MYTCNARCKSYRMNPLLEKYHPAEMESECKYELSSYDIIIIVGLDIPDNRVRCDRYRSSLDFSYQKIDLPFDWHLPSEVPHENVGWQFGTNTSATSIATWRGRCISGVPNLFKKWKLMIKPHFKNSNAIAWNWTPPVKILVQIWRHHYTRC